MYYLIPHCQLALYAHTGQESAQYTYHDTVSQLLFEERRDLEGGRNVAECGRKVNQRIRPSLQLFRHLCAPDSNTLANLAQVGGPDSGVGTLMGGSEKHYSLGGLENTSI